MTRIRNELPAIQDLIPGWLRSHYGISPQLAIIFVLNTLITGRIFVDPEFDSFIGISGITQDVIRCAVVIAVFGAITFYRKGDATPSLKRNLSTWILSGILVVAVQSLAGYINSGNPLTTRHIYLAPVGVLSVVGVLASFTLVIAAYAQHKESSFDLALQRKKLNVIQMNVRRELTKEIEAMELQFVEGVAPLLNEMRESIEKADEKSQLLTFGKDISMVIDTVVRPISRRMESQSDFQVDTEASIDELAKYLRQISIRERLLRRVDLSNAYLPEMWGLVTLTLFIPSIYVTGDLKSALVYGGISTMTSLLLLYVMRRLTQRIELPFLLANLIAIGTSVIVTLPFIGFQKLGSLTPELVAGLWVGLAIVNILTSYFGLLVSRWGGILQEVRAVINEGSHVIARARNEISLTRKRTARLVHGTVQAKLQAAVIRLMRANEFDQALKSSILVDIQTAIDALEIQENPSQQDFGQAMDALIDFWDGVCEVLVHMSGDVDDQISRDRIATECAIEVCREAVSNAVKHDQAETFDISITVPEQQIELEFSHAGQVRSPSTRSGESLGIKIFEELTSSWSMISKSGTLYMQAKIPLTSQK